MWKERNNKLIAGLSVSMAVAMLIGLLNKIGKAIELAESFEITWITAIR